MDIKSLGNKLRDYISSNLEHLFSQPEIIEMKKPNFNQGMESTIYIVIMEYYNQKNTIKERAEFIFKLYEGINSKLLFDSNLSAKSEYIFTTYLIKHKYAVPTIYAYEEENNEISQFPFLFMNLIDGTPLYLYLRELKNKNDNLSIERIWRKHANKLAELHNVNYMDLAKYFKDAVKIEDENHYLDHDMKIWKNIITDHEVSAQFEPILSWLNSQIGLIPLQKYSIVHRDFYLGNLIFDSRDEIIVIDWGVSYLTDFRLDLGYTLMQINLDDNQYITSSEYLEMYERAASIKVKNIEFFEILALIKNLMIQTILESQSSGWVDYASTISFITKTKSYEHLIKISLGKFSKLHQILTGFKIRNN